jgi:hypothetical protein
MPDLFRPHATLVNPSRYRELREAANEVESRQSL